MDTGKIKYQDVRSSGEEIHTLAKNMKISLENITKNVQNLKNAGFWEGNASNYYINKLKKLTSNFEEIYVELENSVLYLANVSDGYEALDKKIMQEICSNLNISEPSLNTSSIFN